MAGRGKVAVAPIQVIVSGGEPNDGELIPRLTAPASAANWRQAATPKQPVDVAPRYWFWNPAAKSRWYLVPGSITIVMTLIGTMLTALVIAREYERERWNPFRHARDPDADPARKAYPVLLPRHVSL